MLVALLEWGGKHAAGPDGPLAELQHADCGAPVRLALTCSAGHMLDSARRYGRTRARSGAVLAGEAQGRYARCLLC